MADLIAQGAEADQRWRRSLASGESFIIGRSPEHWQVDWDDRISRLHAEVRTLDSDRVEVHKLPNARNPIFFRGSRRDQFTLSAGEHFVIGRTTFTLAQRPEVADSSELDNGVTQHAFAPGLLRSRGFRDAASRIEVLSRLPELITSSVSDSELLVRVTGVLLQAIPAASAVAILCIRDLTNQESFSQAVEVLHYDCRLPTNEAPRPSGGLARRAARGGESVLHLWGRGMRRGDTGNGGYTASENVDWAFAVPVRVENGGGWILYATGQLGAEAGMSLEPTAQEPPQNLQDDVKFAEIVAATLGNLRKMRALQQRQAGLSRFFAPVVMEALAGRDPIEVLRPREAEIATLFCDLRGFSRRSEEQGEQLMELLQRVSGALGIMTGNILQQDGVIGDFHGDAAMGFWGWPLAQEDAAGRACRTALDILADFRRQGAQESGPLGRFRCGIGVACGRAVAGRIGTADQVKVTAFGPVVNLASRLEGMTKLFSAEILIDELTAQYVHEHLPSSVARVRRLARVRPVGIRTPLMVHQLLPPATEPASQKEPVGCDANLSDVGIAAYEAALTQVLGGNWEEAFRLLHEVPPGDRAKDFLTVYIASHGRVPPDDWDGVIRLPSK